MLLLVTSEVVGFLSSTSLKRTGISPNFDLKQSSNDNDNESGFPNPLKGLIGMFQNFDDVIDDFMDKKMGNGEVFYGKRKYNPGGEFEGDYEGFGLSDFRKIEGTKEMKEQLMEKGRQREQRQQ